MREDFVYLAYLKGFEEPLQVDVRYGEGIFQRGDLVLIGDINRMSSDCTFSAPIDQLICLQKVPRDAGEDEAVE
jgi:hypothetical protein